MTTLTTKLPIRSWDEKPYQEFDDGRKLTRAEVALGGTETGIDDAAMDSLMYYAADGTTAYVALMRLTGALDGRSGSVVLAGEGTFDGTTARMTLRIVDATGDLVGITGELTSESTHEDYPHMPVTLAYELA